MLPWLCPMLPLCDWLPVPMVEASELPAAPPWADPAPDPEPLCANAKAVLNASTNTNVCEYFFMPVSPRLVDRF